MKRKIQPHIAYKENAIVFGKVICTHCGSDTELLHVELSALSISKPIDSWDTIICRECFGKLPSLQDMEEEEGDTQHEVT